MTILGRSLETHRMGKKFNELEKRQILTKDWFDGNQFFGSNHWKPLKLSKDYKVGEKILRVWKEANLEERFWFDGYDFF